MVIGDGFYDEMMFDTYEAYHTRILAYDHKLHAFVFIEEEDIDIFYHDIVCGHRCTVNRYRPVRVFKFLKNVTIPSLLDQVEDAAIQWGLEHCVTSSNYVRRSKPKKTTTPQTRMFGPAVPEEYRAAYLKSPPPLPESKNFNGSVKRYTSWHHKKDEEEDDYEYVI